MAKYRTLVVENESGMLEVCGDILGKLPDVEISLERSSVRAAELLKEQSWDLLITDIRMPGITGIELLRIAREYDSGIAALIMTAFPSVETAVESMKLGAADYITKPFLPGDFLSTVKRLLENKRLHEEHSLLRRQVERPYSFGEMLGKSAPMLKIFQMIQQVAPTTADILITGETGTGKELIARSIHKNSNRDDQRFVPVDCGAIPDDLLESEFFGHERGAFTGAHARSLGLMEFANEGTLFLDEIGELPVRLQAKLLRSLQERRIRRVGGNSEIDVDVRVVAATARDLEKEIELGNFRSDLFYRINVIRIEIPPLRDRSQDIPLLIRHFVHQYAAEMNRETVDIHPEVIEIMTGYKWPGNVRELQNIVKRFLAISRTNEIRSEDLPDEIVANAIHRSDESEPGFFELREEQITTFEREYLNDLLQKHGGDITMASKDAHLPRGTLYRLLNKHDLTPADFRAQTDA